mmetsp:Transcript_5978/g.9857  ORF Transcript_5978/g.9857 Transcript_5978/m.9857 type:complete len:401 (+) Transcript_5978:91-1293(+)
MMDFILQVPSSVLRTNLFPYLTVAELAMWDTVVVNAAQRLAFHKKLRYSIFDCLYVHDRYHMGSDSILNWLNYRSIRITRLNLGAHLLKFATSSSACIETVTHLTIIDKNETKIIDNQSSFVACIHQLRNLEHLTLRRGESKTVVADGRSKSFTLDDASAIDIVCGKVGAQLRTIDLAATMHSLTDRALIAIGQYCPQLQHLNISAPSSSFDAALTGTNSLINSLQLSDTGFIALFAGCSGLRSFRISLCQRFTNTSLVALSTHCRNLQTLQCSHCPSITDAGLILFSENKAAAALLHQSREVKDNDIIGRISGCSTSGPKLLGELDLRGCASITNQGLILALSKLNNKHEYIQLHQVSEELHFDAEHSEERRNTTTTTTTTCMLINKLLLLWLWSWLFS